MYTYFYSFFMDSGGSQPEKSEQLNDGPKGTNTVSTTLSVSVCCFDPTLS